MKAMRLHNIGTFTLDEVEKPVPTGEEILVRVGACGVCGSDIPRVYELGTRVYPVTIGHEFSGIVEAVGNQKNQGLIGRTAAVFPLIPCMKCASCQTANYAQCENYQYLGSRNDGGFAEYCLLPDASHLVFSADPDADLDALSLVEPATVAQHAVRKGNITAGQTIVIFGAGPIGILAARWAKIFGAKRVILVDVIEEKIAFAKARGLTILNSTKQSFAADLAAHGGADADVVIEGTGTSGGLNAAIACTRTFGTVVLLGNPARDTTIELDNHSRVLRKEIALQGIWNSYYANRPLNEWRYTVEMIDAGKLRVADLITHKVPLVGVTQLFGQIYQREITICKAIYSAGLKRGKR